LCVSSAARLVERSDVKRWLGVQLASASTVERKRCMDILTLLVEKAPQCLHDLLTAEILSHTVAALIDGSLPDGAKEQAARALMLMSLAGDASAQGRICGGAAVAAITACMHAETTAKCRTYCAQALHALAAHASSMSVLVAAEVPMHLEQTLARAADGSEVHSAAVSALGMLTRHAIEGSDAEAMAALLRHNTPEGKREVLKALRRVAESGERAEELVGAGLVRLLVDAVRTTDGRWESGGAGEDAICTLAQLAAAEACRAELVEGDAIGLLISVLRSASVDTAASLAAVETLQYLGAGVVPKADLLLVCTVCSVFWRSESLGVSSAILTLLLSFAQEGTWAPQMCAPEYVEDGRVVPGVPAVLAAKVRS
jgi:hypothetical protein